MRSHYDHYPLRAVDSLGNSSTASSATHHPVLSAASLQPQEEDWITRKRVETVTTKNLERHLQRQVVLDDGRVIEEDEPHVTRDLIEDSQAHEDSGTEEMGTWNDGRAVTSKGNTVFGEKFQRTVNTNDVRTAKTSTAAAVNLGELSRQDVDDVLVRGERGGDVKSFIAKRNPGFNDPGRRDLVIPARVVHSDRSHHRKVDREDVHEINRAHKGRMVTDRIVSREVVEDDNVDTPDYSSSSSTVESSRDGGAHGYTDRKEERFVDYYRVAPGKPTTSGQHIRRGVNMSSRDRESFEKPRTMNNFSSSVGPALTFEGKPPRPERQYRRHSRDQRSRDRMPSSERSLPTRGYHDRMRSPSAGRGREEEDHAGRRFHTIERSEKVGRSSAAAKSSSTSTSKYQRSSRSSSRPIVSKPPRSSMSRSVSRSSSLEKGNSNNEFSTVRKNLDPERESRLRRTLSFNSNKENKDQYSHNGGGGMKSDSSNKSFLGSVKSLYATISKNAKKLTHHPDYYRQDDNNWKPERPPRKHHRSSSNLAGSRDNVVDGSQYSDNVTGRSWSAFSAGGGKDKGGKTYSSGGGAHAGSSSRAVTTTTTSKTSKNGNVTGHSWSPYKMASVEKDQRSSGGRQGRKLERRQTIGAGDNRDPPRFEDPRRGQQLQQRRPRDRSYFGEEDDDSGSGGGGGWRERPVPDMRRLLLDNVNLSRRKSASARDLNAEGPRPIRAI